MVCRERPRQRSVTSSPGVMAMQRARQCAVCQEGPNEPTIAREPEPQLSAVMRPVERTAVTSSGCRAGDARCSSETRVAAQPCAASSAGTAARRPFVQERLDRPLGLAVRARRGTVASADDAGVAPGRVARSRPLSCPSRRAALRRRRGSRRRCRRARTPSPHRGRGRAVAGDAVADALDAGQLLRVEVDEIARPLPLLAQRRCGC